MCECDRQLGKTDSDIQFGFESPFTDPGVVSSPPILPDIIVHDPMPVREEELRNPITRARILSPVRVVPGSPSDNFDDRPEVNLRPGLLPIIGIAAIGLFFFFGKSGGSR